MSKITRIFQNLFGETGDQSHFGQFGSRVASPPGFKTKDPNSIQALSAFTGNGIYDAINSSNKAAFLEDLNGLFLLAFRQIAYVLQDGIPEWETATAYYTGSIVRKPGTTELYGSLSDANIGNALPSRANNAYWSYLNPSSFPPGAIMDYGAATPPLGWLKCDASVVAQASYPDLYSVIGSTFNTGGEGVGNFRLPDHSGRVSLGAGAGAGLSVRNLGDRGGLESNVLTTAELPPHNHPVSILPVGATVGTGTATISGASPGNYLPAGAAQILDVATSNTGGGGAFSNMTPWIGLTKIIKT